MPFHSPTSSGTVTTTSSPAYDSLPEPRSIVASTHPPPWYPPPPPPYATAVAALIGSSAFPRRSRKASHELLTEAEKKANHIASEQKRRQNIRMGFDCLIDVVPTLNPGNKSEALILQKSIEHIHHLISVKNALKNQVRDLQSVLGDSEYEIDSSDDDHSFS